jgi:hypothetical protein
MTLVIAGFDIRKDESRPGYTGSRTGLFVATDSTITSGRQTLLSGFKKVYSVPIKVLEPSIAGGQFRGYHGVKLQTNCFIAFAGSTITAQHILNGVTNHLSELQYVHRSKGFGVPGTYHVQMACEPNRLNDSGVIWDDDMFLDSDLRNLLSGEVVAKTILHVLRVSLGQAKRHKIDQAGWESLLTQYVLGTYCEVDQCEKLYIFKPRFVHDGPQIVDIEIDQNEIPFGELAVLGMTHFEPRAREAFDAAFSAGKDVAKAMFAFLNLAIDEVQANGRLEIDRPSVLRSFQQGELVELDRAT